jgi:hypothetical protein
MRLPALFWPANRGLAANEAKSFLIVPPLCIHEGAE